MYKAAGRQNEISLTHLSDCLWSLDELRVVLVHQILHVAVQLLYLWRWRKRYHDCPYHARNVHNFKSKPFLPGKISSLIPRSSRRKPGNEAGRFQYETTSLKSTRDLWFFCYWFLNTLQIVTFGCEQTSVSDSLLISAWKIVALLPGPKTGFGVRLNPSENEHTWTHECTNTHAQNPTILSSFKPFFILPSCL